MMAARRDDAAYHRLVARTAESIRVLYLEWGRIESVHAEAPAALVDAMAEFARDERARRADLAAELGS